MPPAFAVIVIIGVGVPAAVRALVGRPRAIVASHVAAVTAALLAQVLAEVAGWRTGVLGDAQVLVSGLGALGAALAVALLERRPE
ncbi:MAG: hypothetical protein EXR61_02965 [Chloroflexi bacterium]|nr:hypothetical protein [Chloroflexota bacterium]